MLVAPVQPAVAAQFQAPDIAVDEGEVAVFRVTLADSERRKQSWLVSFELQGGFSLWCCAPQSPFQR